MKLLFIGGTGLISSACSALAIGRGHELFILNRAVSTKYSAPKGSTILQANIYADEAALATLFEEHHFDAVVDFIAYTTNDIERDIRLFREKTNHFVFISSASAYQKPVRNYLITEETPLANPYWQYSRNKIACENRLMQVYRDEGFPTTIIRPSHTYGPTQIPFAVGSWTHPWTNIDRIKRGRKLIIPGDGTSLWVLTWNADFAKGVYQALGLEPNVIHIPSDLIAKYWSEAEGGLIGDKSNSVVFDNSKIKRFVPDFVCEVDWADGLRRTLAWFEKYPEFQTIEYEMNPVWDHIIAAYERAFP